MSEAQSERRLGRAPNHDAPYEDQGRLKERLEAARVELDGLGEVLRERHDLRAEVERAITELERAIARAAPRYQ